MKILFLARRHLYFRNFESVIRELASRGHDIHLAAERDDIEGRPPLIDALVAEYPNVTCGDAPGRGDDEWNWAAGRLRLGLDYLRYQHPAFDTAPKLRARARERTPGMFVALGDGVRRYGRWARRPAAGVLRWLERAIPDDDRIGAFIAAQQPDVVLLTPLIDLGSSQIDYLRAANAMRIPTALAVWSWDHLSSKALVREHPDRVFVWNETQKDEAIELHGVPAARVVVTGAQCFDQWFDRRPSRDRETFCGDVGLPADRPFVLYVCSAPFLGSQPEAPFVVEWIRRVRASGIDGLHDAPIVVRPHPSRTREWEGVDVTALGAVLHGRAPVDTASRGDYFDTLYHSGAIVGLNTSAFIEGGIVGRPVHTILLPEWAENQTGTLHFRYLLETAGGLVEAAHDFDTHLRQLAASLGEPSPGRGPDAAAPRVRPFVRAFVRPHGLDVAATPLFVRAVEEMQGMTVRPLPGVRAAAPARAAVSWLVRHREDPRYEPWLHSARELEVIERDRRLHAEKAAREADRRAARDAERQAKQAARDAEWERHRAARAARDAEKKAMGRVG
jgi:hypothetical protein